jgi:hypothetical protein
MNNIIQNLHNEHLHQRKSIMLISGTIIDINLFMGDGGTMRQLGSSISGL